MASIRPAGFSDDDTDSDDEGFMEKPTRRYYPVQYDTSKKKIENAIQDAIINGSVDDLEIVIAKDLNNNVNCKLDSGWTPLMHACFQAQDEVVAYLLEKGADPNLHADSVTPLMASCSNASADSDVIFNIVNRLLEKDAYLNIGDKYGQTSLMRAINNGRVAVVQELLQRQVNIEMRDQQGWTAVFWAVYHNQPEILEILIEKNARLTEVDKAGRLPSDIAMSHDNQNILDIINAHTQNDDDDEDANGNYKFSTALSTWHDCYPGVKAGQKVDYANEIKHLLYGMNCEKLAPLFEESGIELKTFLLLEENDMINLGIDMPYMRRRLIQGLQKFHTRGWKIDSVAGLYAQRIQNYSVLDCLTTLGTHLQQIYILEATLQYALREYAKVKEQLKFEPQESPIMIKLSTELNKTKNNITSIRREMKTLKTVLAKISQCNPPPADLIKEEDTGSKMFGVVSQIVIACSIAIVMYRARHIFTNVAIFKK